MPWLPGYLKNFIPSANGQRASLLLKTYYLSWLMKH